MSESLPSQPIWRDDIDSLAFRPPDHDGLCVVHRLAFRSLLGIEAVRDACIEYFLANRPAFEAAAATKIARQELPRDANFHLNSRDVRARGSERGQSML